DLYQVRTLGEEVYTQFVAPEPGEVGTGDPVARAVAVALPFAALAALLLAGAARRWERTLPSGEGLAPPPVFPLGRARSPLCVAVGLLVLVLVGLPAGSLAWKSGLAGAPPAW